VAGAERDCLCVLSFAGVLRPEWQYAVLSTRSQVAVVLDDLGRPIPIAFCDASILSTARGFSGIRIPLDWPIDFLEGQQGSRF
jgi:hypothetical protein